MTRNGQTPVGGSLDLVTTMLCVRVGPFAGGEVAAQADGDREAKLFQDLADASDLTG